MSTWQIFSDADNSFRWEVSDQQFHVELLEDESGGAPTPAPNSAAFLPSMADLLLQGCSELIGNREGQLESSQMFRSGLGKSVSVKQSSITKALSIIGDEGDAFGDTGQFRNGSDFGRSFSNSMFQTGSGKKVNISSAGLVRAQTLLGLKESYDHDTLPPLKRVNNESITDEPLGLQNPSPLVIKECHKDATTAPTPLFNFKTNSIASDSKREAIPHLIRPPTKGPPIKFHTAGGRSISVSSDALKRAKSLLGDLELGTFFNEGDANNPAFSFSKQGILDENQFNRENNLFLTPYHQEIAKSKHLSKSFVSPLRSDSHRMQSSLTSENVSLGTNLIKKFDAEDFDNTSKMSNNTLCQQKPLGGRPSLHVQMGKSLANGVSSRSPLVDISNKVGMAHMDSKLAAGEKRMLGKSSVSPFKRPRSSRFITPLNQMLSAASGLSALAPEKSCSQRRVSTQYPFQVPRIYVKEYFGVPLSHLSTLKQMPYHIRKMNSEHAEKFMFEDGSGVECIGAEDLYHMLAQSGASIQYASKEWVRNHYKWIVWKLACYERCYPDKSSGKLLTVCNVLEELKYRYEREVNHGQRSSIKRILEGDQPPSSMLVLCVSSICLNNDMPLETRHVESNNAESGSATKVELTDGWYSINALLDVLLLKKLADGKLFVGQKLRIWGAGLCGWAGPVSPLQASNTVGLQLHINGTYRAHWADRLGLCKGSGAPLAFRCIKGKGGPVPSTLIGVIRIYPVLYRERLCNGECIVRSERREAKMLQLYNHRHAWVLNLMRKFTKKELTRPAITRFATQYLTLRRLHETKIGLRAMFGSEEWQRSPYAKKGDGIEVTEIILADKNFWPAIQYCLKCTLPLVKVLRLVDGDAKPAMGYIYEAMDKAKEQIAKNFQEVRRRYQPIWDIIDTRWNMQLHRPLHAAAYYLNPKFHYTSSQSDDDYEIKMGLYDTIQRMCPTPALRAKVDRQLESFHNAEKMFGIEMAIQMRSEKQPAMWWSSFGGSCKELQSLAIRVLSLTCSATGCERNWSTFDQVHTKRRNRLEQQRVNALVFTKYNLRLEARYQKRLEEGDAYDPISLSDMESDDEWITEKENPLLPEDTAWLDIDECFQLQEGQSSKKRKRGPRDLNKIGKGKQVITVDDDEENEEEIEDIQGEDARSEELFDGNDEDFDDE